MSAASDRARRPGATRKRPAAPRQRPPAAAQGTEKPTPEAPPVTDPGAATLPMASMREALQAAFLRRFEPGRKGFRAVRGQAAAPDAEQPAAPAVLPPRAWRHVGRDVAVLHEVYTETGGTFSHEENPIHQHLAGYQFYFLPRNVYRIFHVLSALPWREAPRPALAGDLCVRGEGMDAHLEVLDLGCGTGAFSLALLAWLGAVGDPAALPPVRITLVDQAHYLLALAAENVRAFARTGVPGLTVELRPEAQGVEQFLQRGRAPGGGFGVVGAGFMLGELNLLGPRRVGRRAARLVEPLRALVQPNGLLAFVEPGTRKGYMNVMAVRERLLDEAMLYPCPHNGPCPLWDGQVSRWCHATRPLPQPFFFDAELRRHARLDFHMTDVNLSALAVQAAGSPRVAAPFAAQPGARVVSGRLPPRAMPAAEAPAQKVAQETAQEAAPRRVVLLCAPDGRLHEAPVPGLGRYPRGAWVPRFGARK